jgi:hypothetical protein
MIVKKSERRKGGQKPNLVQNAILQLSSCRSFFQAKFLQLSSTKFKGPLMRTQQKLKRMAAGPFKILLLG